jgi:5-methylcytosine-specific restriction endonuclease McrA
MTRKEERKLIDKIEKKADNLWRDTILKSVDYKCEVCGGVANQVHHYFPKGQNGHLRYCWANGVPICPSCHVKHHRTYNPSIHATVANKRGRKWYEKLNDKARLKPTSFKNLKWYQEQLVLVEKGIK